MKYKSLFYTLIVTIMLFFPAIADASQGMRQPECAIKGLVTAESKKIEDGKGISAGEKFTYHDVTINILASALSEEGKLPEFSEKCIYQDETKIFQRRDKNFFSPKLTGKCISAKTRWSGDGNFRSGDWLYDIKILDSAECH